MKATFLENKEIIFILTVLALFLGWNLNMPYVGLHESCNLWYGQVAKNYQIKGFFGTKFAPHLFLDPDIIYLNHPILFSLLVGLMNKIFGFSNAVGRMVPITLSVFTILFQYLLVKEVWNKKIAIWACFFASFFPMTILFGKLMNYEPIVLFFSVFSLYYYQLYKTKGKNIYSTLMLIGLALAMLTDWPGYIVTTLLCCYTFLVDKNRKLALYLFAILALISTLQLGYIIYISGNVDLLLNIFFTRTGIETSARGDFPYVSWIMVLFLRTIIYFSPLLYILIPILIIKVFTKKHSLSRDQMGILFIFLVYASLYTIIFKDGSYQHNFWIYHFIPFLSITSALGIEHINRHKIFRVVLVVVFLVSSLFVVITLKKYEKKNVEIYNVLAEVVQDGNIKELKTVPVVFTRQFESMLLAYYFDLKIKEITNQEALEKLILEDRQEKLILITNNFSNLRQIDQMKKFLLQRYDFYKHSGNRFEVYVFDLHKGANQKLLHDNTSPLEVIHKTKKRLLFIDKLVIPLYTKIITYFSLPEI